MKISRKWLQKYFEQELPAAGELADKLTFHAFEIEGVEDTAGDSVIDIKVLPDRAHYCLSHSGIAGEVGSILSIKNKPQDIPNIKDTFSAKPTIAIEDAKFCRRYVGRIVEGISVGDPKSATASSSSTPTSPEWLRANLETIGQRSINPIVDITNYVMFDVGQPLHAFDADQVKGTIVVRSARSAEKITLLDGREVELTTEDSVIADEIGPLAIAGVKGGKRAEVGPRTKRIIIESANFNPTAVRKTSTRLNLRNESSKRFENEITPELAEKGMALACKLIQDFISGSKFGPIEDIYPVRYVPTEFDIDPNYISLRLGIQVPLDVSRMILTNMGMNIKDSGRDWKISVPANRLDITMKEDIVEEVGRIYGYDKIPGILPPKPDKSATILPTFYLQEKIKDILIGSGFSEVSLYSLVSKGQVETVYPLARDKSFLRTNLTDGMKVCLDKNVLLSDVLGLDAVKVFELGHVFTAQSETLNLAIGASQVKKTKGVNGETLVTAAVGALSSIAGELGLDLVWNKNPQKNIWETTLVVNDKIKDIDISFGPSSPNKFKKFSLYPFIVRDIAVLGPESITSEDMWGVIYGAIKDSKSEGLLTRNSLFDVFKKDGKVSHAYRLVFQSMETTLTDEAVNAIMSKVNEAVVAKGWVVR